MCAGSFVVTCRLCYNSLYYNRNVSFQPALCLLRLFLLFPFCQGEIQREFLRPVTPVVVPLHSADTSTSSMDNTVDQVHTYVRIYVQKHFVTHEDLCGWNG